MMLILATGAKVERHELPEVAAEVASRIVEIAVERLRLSRPRGLDTACIAEFPRPPFLVR